MNQQIDPMRTNAGMERRFTVPQRIEHAVLAVSFTILGFSGLIQKYASNSAANRLIEWLGGIEATRLLHRWAAGVFSLLAVYHVVALAYKFIVQRAGMTMMPVKKDVSDAFRLLGYNLFLTPEPPRMPRYNFAEKLEYWALIWGGVIMAVTGFMLWNPLITTGFLPGQFIPAAKAAHGGEAVLAVLAIIVWHFYNVHLKFFNRSMFTGRMTRHQMEEEHGGEIQRLLAAAEWMPPARPSYRRRMALFIPVAAACGAAGLGTIYWAATAETTAISTLPSTPHPGIVPPERAQVLPAARPGRVPAPLIPHELTGWRQCNQCHGLGGISPAPANHQGRPIESCRICHKPAPAPKAGKAVETKAAAGTPAAIPHSIERDAFKDCAQCHGAGKLKPSPENHAAFPAGSCQACHQAAPSKQ